MAIGIGSVIGDIDQKVDAYRNNPEALMRLYQQNPQLIDLLALQKLKTEKESAIRDMQMKAQTPNATVKDQREQQVLAMTRNEVAGQVAPGLQMLAQQQQQAQQQGQAPQQQGQAPQQAPQQGPSPGGLPTLPAPNMQNIGMAGGGIVAFQEGQAVPKAVDDDSNPIVARGPNGEVIRLHDVEDAAAPAAPAGISTIATAKAAPTAPVPAAPTPEDEITKVINGLTPAKPVATTAAPAVDPKQQKLFDMYGEMLGAGYLDTAAKKAIDLYKETVKADPELAKQRKDAQTAYEAEQARHTPEQERHDRLMAMLRGAKGYNFADVMGGASEAAKTTEEAQKAARTSRLKEHMERLDKLTTEERAGQVGTYEAGEKAATGVRGEQTVAMQGLQSVLNNTADAASRERISNNDNAIRLQITAADAAVQRAKIAADDLRSEREIKGRASEGALNRADLEAKGALTSLTASSGTINAQIKILETEASNLVLAVLSPKEKAEATKNINAAISAYRDQLAANDKQAADIRAQLLTPGAATTAPASSPTTPAPAPSPTAATPKVTGAPVVPDKRPPLSSFKSN